MISLAHMTQGDAVRNTTLSRMLPGALTRAFISEWIQPQLPGTAESQRLGRPRALPLYPMASTFSSRWSVTTVPTCSRAQVERLASSSAMRMYTSYNGMRSTRGAAAPSGSTLRKCVLAVTPSLKTLMQLLIGIVVAVAPPGALLGEPGVEPRRHQPVRALLTLRRAGCEAVGVFVLRVPRMALDPSPLDPVRRRGLNQFLPEVLILEHAALALPAACFPPGHPLAHPLDEVLGVGNVHDARVLPLAADPFQGSNRARQGHLVVGRLWGGFIEIPPRDAVSRGRLDQRGIPAGARFRPVVAQSALIGVDQDSGAPFGRAGHVRAG